MSNFGRHDYRDPAREKFGKPSISYPDGSLLHPTLTEVFDHRKDSTTGALPYLSLSQNPRAQGCYLTRQALGKGDDDSVNLTVVYERLPGAVKTSYPVDETYKIGTKVQNQIVIAADNPPWTGARLSGEFTLTELPSANETVTVGAMTYKFVAALTGAANEVLIAPTMAGTLFNLSSAINLDWGAGVNFGNGTAQNRHATSWIALTTMVVADTNNPSAAITTTTTCLNGRWTAPTAQTALFIEIKEIDANRMHRIASRVTLPLPADVTYWMGREVCLPDTLQSLTPIWNDSRTSGGSTQSPPAPAMAQASASHLVDGGVGVEIVNGFRGTAKAQFTRHFSLTPPAEGEIATPTVIKPSLGTVTISVSGENVSQSDGELSAGFSAGNSVNVRTQHIGPVLTGSAGIAGAAVTGVTAMDITNGGTCYTATPTVIISGGGGSGATATAARDGAGVAQINITNHGKGYTSAPTVTLGGGIGVAGVTVSNSGSGYNTAPAVVFSGGGGSGAAAVAVLSYEAVSGIVITNPGSGYTSVPAVSFRVGQVWDIVISNGGAAYTPAPSVVFSGGGGSGAAGTAVLDGNGAVSGIAITNPGSGYTFAPAVSFSGGVAVTGVAVGSGGSGYSISTVVTFSGGGGTGAAGIAVVSGGVVTDVTIVNPGYGYSSAPTVTITDSLGGSGATATATIGGGAAATAYISTGSGATATASIGAPATAVAQIGTIDDGSGNFYPPDVTAYSAAPDGSGVYPAAQVSATARGNIALNMPPSVPPQFNSGDMILESVTVQQWRLGLYITETVSVKVP